MNEPIEIIPGSGAELKMDEEILFIFWRPPFENVGIYTALRNSGVHIKTHHEEEQAAAIHWMLNLYLKHGAAWREEGAKFLRQHLPQKPA